VITAQIGLEAVMWGQVFQSIIFYFPNKYYSDRLIGYSFIEQFKDVGLYYIASGLVYGVTLLIVAQVQANAFVSIALAFSLFSALYISFIFWVDKPLVHEVLKVVKKA
jgi:ABC-type amino acid transport system permease subunit